MSRRLHRIWLMPLLLLASQSWALGLGDIRVSSALNQPLRAEIELLATTPEELNNLTVALASVETFERYDLDRPLFLSRINFEVVRSGRADGNFIRITSANAISEPFVTLIVEAVWSRGRLLREYTVLLDPPTFAPPPATQASQEVTAPSRATPTDSGEIQRPAAQQQTAPAPQPRPAVQAPVQSAPAEPVQSPSPSPSTSPSAIGPEPTPTRPAEQDQGSFDTTSGGDLVVQRGDTLWGISRRMRPDSRLTMNQTMLAIYEANPDAFVGNINRLRAGAILRIPSADDVFRITRTDAFAEVKRQNEAWGGLPGLSTPAPTPDVAPVVDTQPNLTLVPPDDDVSLTDTSVTSGTPDADIDALPIDPDEARIEELEALFADQESLIEIEDNELAALRAELAALRGEELPPVDDTLEDPVLDDELPVDDVESLLPDDALVDDAADDTQVVAPPVVSAPVRDEPGLVDVLMGYLTNFWVIIGFALAAAIALLVWFMRRAANDDEEATGVWETIDVVDSDAETLAATSSLSAMAQPDDTTILVEEARAPRPAEMPVSDTIEAPAALEPEAPATADPLAETGLNQSLEDTFSSETAINLDQTDPMAEADFHMAYGLYDQAADLINGALATDPGSEDLLAKLCEIYFVWGNRDAFVDAAGRMKAAAGSDSNAEWDKIVIMGQQIAADHEMFSGVSAGAATKAVDLSFDSQSDETGALDMDLADDSVGDASDVIDLGAESGELPSVEGDDVVSEETGQMRIADAGNDIDFSFDEPELEASATREMPEADSSAAEGDETADTPILDESVQDDAEDPFASSGTVESPTIEQQFETFDATGELPVIADPDEAPPASDQTAEINLDDLGLDLDSLSDPSIAEAIDDNDDTAISQVLDVIDDFEATGTDIADLAKTGENPALDVPAESAQTGIHESLDIDSTGLQNALPDLDEVEDTDIGLDTSLLDATGQTQVLSEDMIVQTGADIGAALSDDDKTMLAPSLADDSAVEDLAADAATMLAPLDDDEDEGDFDFAKTEALPKDSFSSDMSDGMSLDDTGKMQSLAGGTDMDLDLDDLTAALRVSEVGDTINQKRDDATVEQPRLKPEDVDLDVGMMVDDGGERGTTQALAPDDLSGDLHDARTMTEVGTKLDLARAYVDMGDPSGARSILEEVLDEGDEGQRQQAQKLLGSLPS